MPGKIKEVLAEANLTEAQVEQIAQLVLAERASLRNEHAEQIKQLNESKDEIIAGLTRDNMERTQQLEEAALRGPDAEETALIESHIRKEVTAQARALLVEALAPYRNHIRAVRNYAAMTELVESMHDAMATVFAGSSFAVAEPVALNESNDADQVVVLEERVQQLETQLFEASRRDAFAAATAGLAETSKAKVQAIAGASSFTTLDEYNEILAAAVAAVKTNKGETPTTNLDESNQPKGSGQMSRYVAALGSSHKG